MSKKLLGFLFLMATTSAMGAAPAQNGTCDIDSVSNFGLVRFDTGGCRSYSGRILIEVVGKNSNNTSFNLWEVIERPAANDQTYQFRGIRNGDYRIRMYVYRTDRPNPLQGDGDEFVVTGRPANFSYSHQ